MKRIFSITIAVLLAFILWNATAHCKDIKVMWDINEPRGKYYIVEYSKDGGQTWIEAGSSTTNTFIVPDLAPGDYRFKVKGANMKIVEESNSSGEVPHTVLPRPAEPGTVRVAQ